MLEDNCMRATGPMSDIDGNNQLKDLGDKKPKSGNKQRREQTYVVRDLVTCLALCHNVTPTYPDPEDPTLREFQASSPDEIALVRFADNTLGMKLLERD
jgi:phospholipid-translocating ATPase